MSENVSPVENPDATEEEPMVTSEPTSDVTSEQKTSLKYPTSVMSENVSPVETPDASEEEPKLTSELTSSEPIPPLSKNAQRKQRRLQNLKEARKRKKEEAKIYRAENKRQRMEDGSEQNKDFISKKDRKTLEREKLTKGMESGFKIVLDLRWHDLQTDKELTHLAQQLGRVYGANKLAPAANVTLTGLEKGGRVDTACRRTCDGFEKYLWHVKEENLEEVFKGENIVYLSPDAEEALDTVEDGPVYVIGGLSDDSVKKKATRDFATEKGIECRRLPIAEHTERAADTAGSFKQILTVNQVFSILKTKARTGCWKEALREGLPKRCGWVVKESEDVVTETNVDETEKDTEL